MATRILIVLLMACAVTIAQEDPMRNTIFPDEQLDGGTFSVINSKEISRTYPDNVYRLPNTTKPNHYDILWTIDLTALTFNGTVTIQLEATQPNVNEIVLHADAMSISDIILRLGDVVVPHTPSQNQTQQFIMIRRQSGTFDYNANNPVIYTLSMSFSAPLRTDMYGIYRSWYRNSPSDPPIWMASTQFQATAARWAFPCYDEPSFKATFNVTIRRPVAYRSWSNTRLRITNLNTPLAGYSDDIYHRTPVMSTYLLAILVAQYESREVLNSNNSLMYDVIARPAAINANQGDYALNVGQRLLAQMSNHTDLDFYSVDPHIKMTQAAIPDFSAGAMENWGLLTYREAYVMYDPNHTSSYFKQLIAYILTHEIAHMWFGNLVTCDWWDVTWLNEGFARYYQYFLTKEVETEMGFETRFIVEQVQSVMLTDSANNPTPITNPGLASNAEVSGMFFSLSYGKGASIIRMTEHLFGSEVHRRAIRTYLNVNRFKAVRPEVLIDVLQTTADAAGALSEYSPNFSVHDYFKTWTEKPGVPVIFVQVNHQTGHMTITQRRFNINSGYSPVNTNWIIPITFATQSNPNFFDTKPTHIIRDTITIIDRGFIGDQWVIFNKQQTGYYRVNYDEYTWNLITIALRGPNRTQIHDYNRAQIVDDVFQFARSGLMSYTKAFNILSFLENETDYAPWVAAINGFNWLRARFAGTPNLNLLNNLIIKWATPLMNSLTYYPIANESFMRSYLRYQMAPVMCNLQVPACIEAVQNQIRQLVDNNVEVPVDSRNWAYCYGARDGDIVFERLWTRFNSHNTYNEKIVLLQTLGCTVNETNLKTFLDAIVEQNNVIRPQDYTVALNSVTAHVPSNVQRLLNYISANLQAVEAAFGNIVTPLSYVYARLSSQQDVASFIAWADQNRDALGNSYNAVVNGALSTNNSFTWANQVSPDVVNYLVNGDDNIVATTSAPVSPPVVVTEPVPPLVEPSSPDLPSSAVSTVVSAFAIVLALTVHLILV